MIGIFDSGAGGLTAVKEIQSILPEYDIAYFGDTARFPYGTQSLQCLKRYAEEDAAFLLSKGAKLMVIACNSASAAAGDYLKTRLNVPVFDVIGPAVEEARQRTKNGRVGILATKATVKSGIYESLLKNEDGKLKVFSRAAPLLVPLVEERWGNRPETKRIVRYYLRPLKDARIDTLILACTHYPILQNQIEQVVGKNITVINPAKIMASALKKFFEATPSIAQKLPHHSQLTFYVSSDAEHFQQTARWWLGQNVAVEEITLEVAISGVV